MTWVGPRGAITFTELQTTRGDTTRLSGLSLRDEHPADWEELRFVFWLSAESDDLVVEPGAEGRSAERPGHRDAGGRGAERSPNGQLTPITEEPSDFTEDSLFSSTTNST